jgi:hypothetical protein
VCDEGPEGHGTVLGSWSVLVVDEEGKLRGKPANRLATVLAAEVLHGDVIAGDAVLCTVWDPGTAKERWS